MNNVAPLRDQIVAKLYSAVISDALDAAGHPRQAMRPFLRPLDDSLVLFGRVRTGLYANSYHVDLSKNPYAVEIALVDDLQTGDVPVLACGGPTEQIAPWGELLTTASTKRGASGCVTDGLSTRCSPDPRAWRSPSSTAASVRSIQKAGGEMIARDVPVECAGVREETGDWIFGDADGVVVVPQTVARAIFAEALRKVESEDRTRQEASGRSEPRRSL